MQSVRVHQSMQKIVVTLLRVVLHQMPLSSSKSANSSLLTMWITQHSWGRGIFSVGLLTGIPE